MAELKVFEVTSNDEIIVPGYDNPVDRAEYYGLCDAEFDTADSLMDASEEYGCVFDLVYNLFDEERYYLMKELHALPESDDSPRKKELKAMLVRMEDDDSAALRAWLRQLSAERFAEISKIVTDWLVSGIDSDDLDSNGCIQGNSGAYAFEILGNEDPSILDFLGIELIDGQSPGKDLQVAILTLSIEQANEISIRLGLKYRFERAVAA